MSPPAGELAAARRARLTEILKARSLKRGEFKLASGGTSSFFLDVKPTILSPEGAHLVGALVLAELDQLTPRPVCVGGLETGAIPIVQSVVLASYGTARPIEGFFVRKQPKATGTRARIEGELPAGAHVVLVEDVTTQGQSSLKAVEVVRESGCTVDTVITVVDRLSGATETMSAHDIRLVPLLTIRDLGVA